MDEPYGVHLVSNDVSALETMKDIIHALDSLSTTIDNVFSRIENKITTEKNSLNNINQRISACKTKVQAVKGSKKPTIVFSTAKFPGSNEYPLYPTVARDDKMTDIPTSYKAAGSIQYFPADPKKSSIGNNDLTVELQALVCQLHLKGTDIVSERVQLMEEKGLGPFPLTIQSIGSLLLFNSNINPYKDYQTLDNLASSGRSV